MLGVEHPEQFIDFENRVLLEHTSFIDGYIPSTKVIDPLFLTALKKELADALAISVDKTRDAALQAFRHKLASLRFLDIKTPRLIQFNYSSADFAA